MDFPASAGDGQSYSDDTDEEDGDDVFSHSVVGSVSGVLSQNQMVNAKANRQKK